ncbi:HDOD domain-containing protein [Fluviispira multicolorata]|uniref:HDOD domain-containing protein n=1 Tax=Fluviispira multicolorata TaxID=2654512 RepID=A0A833N5S3_9BACT|nr:HDOD domain-containing protein [Fluviispira multicolorata]KAB8033699.1 HDOD domain-containing protein [Fluviispira multicolorata]
MKMHLPEGFKLPAMPQIARECLVYLYNPNADTGVLSKSLSRDIGISASILKLANSSQFLLGKGAPTSDLNAAILRIGHDNLRQLMILHALEATFVFKDSMFFDFKSFSKHCSFVSLLCTDFAKKIAPDSIADIQMAGLMHDVGLAIMGSLFHENLSLMVKYCFENKVDFAIAEEKLGLEPHCKLGARALDTWEIPARVKLIISLHDSRKPDDRKEVEVNTIKLLDILILSDILAHSYGFGFKEYKRDTRIELSMLKRMGISAEDVKEIVKSALETEAALSST